MPKGFTRCVRGGGRVRTLKPKGRGSSTYLHVCYKGGRSYPGEVKHRKSGHKRSHKRRR